MDSGFPRSIFLKITYLFWDWVVNKLSSIIKMFDEVKNDFNPVFKFYLILKFSDLF